MLLTDCKLQLIVVYVIFLSVSTEAAVVESLKNEVHASVAYKKKYMLCVFFSLN